ncbi:MAG: tetratricopeptide repeat protein [Myxococcota bacterium]|nr:tetratricopeptide repeat protein [Myxococcota bacterium]
MPEQNTLPEVIQGIVAVPQEDVRLLLEAGYLYMEFGKPDEAEEVFDGVGMMLPHSEVPQMALGNLYFSQGRFNPALKAHQKAVSLNDTSAAAHASVGEILLFLRRPDEAMKELDKAINLDPEGSAGQFAEALREAHSQGIFA